MDNDSVFINPSASNILLKDCRVVLEDYFSGDSTVKSNLLKANQENTHSVLSQKFPDSYLQNLEKKLPIAWPPMSDEKGWSCLDKVVSSVMQPATTLQERVDVLESAIYNEAANLFGFTPPAKKRLTSGKNRRVRRSIDLVVQKNDLIQQMNVCEDPVLKRSLLPLLQSVKARLASLRRSERNRKRRWKRKQAILRFSKNPYQAGKDVLDPKCFASLSVEKGVLDDHKASIVSDQSQHMPLPLLEGLPPAPTSNVLFDTKQLSYSDFSKVVHSRRNGSSPGVNMIPYKVYKKCPNVCFVLFRIFKSCFRNAVVPIQWRIASEVYIPKVKNPSIITVKDFRPISLLNVEGKLFFSLISNRLEKHIITNNKFINQAVQKGCMEKVPGSWEHMSVVWDALKNAKKGKGDLAAIWLDVANAYPSVPHQLIFLALKRYGVPEHWVNLFRAYYGGLWSISRSVSCPSGWHHHQRGLFVGCPASIILFLSAINVVIE